MYTTATKTSTYTVVDVRKTFENFEAEVLMIARRTGKWSTEHVEKVVHDVLKFAEANYLDTVSIVLSDLYGTPIRATKYKVNAEGTSMIGDRAGGIDWPDIPYTGLSTVITFKKTYGSLSPLQQQQFSLSSGMMLTWSPTNLNTEFPGLSKQQAQMFASNGYELNKTNYK